MVRQRSAKPPPPVQIWVPPFLIKVRSPVNEVFKGDRTFQFSEIHQGHNTKVNLIVPDTRVARNRVFSLKSFVLTYRLGKKPGFFGLDAPATVEAVTIVGDRQIESLTII